MFFDQVVKFWLRDYSAQSANTAARSDTNAVLQSQASHRSEAANVPICALSPPF